jgi:hypothetical protein
VHIEVELGSAKLSAQNLMIWTRALCAWNCDWLRAHPEAPLFYQAGLRYQREQPGEEDFQPIPKLYQTRRGDCEDLAAARCSELIVRFGVAAVPEVIEIRKGLFHVFCRLPNGLAEDPSAHLGMEIPDDMRRAGQRKLAAMAARGRTHPRIPGGPPR